MVGKGKEGKNRKGTRREEEAEKGKEWKEGSGQ